MNKNNSNNILISTKNLSKTFGKTNALTDITMNLGPGIWGLIGPNGAGKTTLINILLGLYRKSSGSYKIFGLDPSKNQIEIKSQIGFSFTLQNFPGDMNYYQYLSYIADSYMISKKSSNAMIDYLTNKLDLQNASTKNIQDYSTGMKQKLSIAQCLLALPRLAILDEPFANLDPDIKVYARELFIEFNTKFKVNFLISSHELQDLQTFCSHIIFIDHGRLIWKGSRDEIPNNDLVSFYMEKKIKNNIKKYK